MSGPWPAPIPPPLDPVPWLAPISWSGRPPCSSTRHLPRPPAPSFGAGCAQTGRVRKLDLASSNKGSVVGGRGHYLNSRTELGGGILDLIRARCSRLDQLKPRNPL